MTTTTTDGPHSDEGPHDDTVRSRRNFLRRGWQLGGTLLGIAAGWTVFESLRPLAGADTGAVITLGTPDTYPPGTSTYVPEGRLYLTNADSQLFALAQKCPHLGCRVPFCESSGRFECACHGSVFDLGGELVSGPAPRGMDRFPVAVDNGVVEVDTTTVSSGPDPGASQYLTPPKGPSCIGGG